MERGPISPNTHAAIEPIMALLFILAPWIFGFSDITEAATISIIVGAAMLVSGMLTRWRLSLVKLIPLRTHFMMDLGLAAVLVLSPFVFGFIDEGSAARFMIIAGVLEALAALGTRWNPAEAEAGDRRTGRVRSARA